MKGFNELTEISLDDQGRIVGLKGRIRPIKVFHVVTDKVLFWAEFNLDYCGG